MTIAANPASHVKLILKKDRDFDEWQVRVYEDGKLNENATYFGGSAYDEDAKEDAIATALEMARFYQAGGATVELGAGLRQRQVNPARSKAQFRWAHAAHRRGEITKKQLKKIIEGTDYHKLPERVGKGRKGKRKMARKTRRRKKTKAQIKRERLKNLAKARRAKAAKRPRYTFSSRFEGLTEVVTPHPIKRKRRRSVRRTKNFEMSHIPPAAYIREWYRVDGVKKKISSLAAAELRARGHKVEKASAPVRRGPRKKTAKKRVARARAKHKRKGTRKGRTARRAYMKTAKRRTGRKRSKAAIRRERLRNLAKARAARARKAGRRAPRRLGRRSIVRRAVSSVMRKRPHARRSTVRKIATRDYRRKVHRRGKRKVQRLARDVRFEMDFREAFKRQRLGASRLRSRIRRMGAHPAHLSKRKTSPSTRKGWREFAGTSPNTVATMKNSPVKGKFNGVLIDEIHGKLAHSGQTVVIRPPKNAPLYFIWAAGARTFEIVGPTNAITSLAKGIARANEPIQITRLNYLAPTYPAPAGTRRTGRERMHVAYTHAMRHKVFITWNGKSGSSARFPIITRGTRGKSMVNRSGIIL